jgi:hypothetical protein
MSFTATRHSKNTAKTCESCRARKARFQFRGSVRADRDHTLCFACFRAERERRRAATLVASEPLAGTGLIGRMRLSRGQVRHREQMLEHLAGAQA